jgi:hypothetical protein
VNAVDWSGARMMLNVVVSAAIVSCLAGIGMYYAYNNYPRTVADLFYGFHKVYDPADMKFLGKRLLAISNSINHRVKDGMTWAYAFVVFASMAAEQVLRFFSEKYNLISGLSNYNYDWNKIIADLYLWTLYDWGVSDNIKGQNCQGLKGPHLEEWYKQRAEWLKKHADDSASGERGWKSYYSYEVDKNAGGRRDHFCANAAINPNFLVAWYHWDRKENSPRDIKYNQLGRRFNSFVHSINWVGAKYTIHSKIKNWMVDRLVARKY